MIIVSLIAAALTSRQEFAIPEGASPEYRKLAKSVEDAMVARNFALGSKLITQLPSAHATYRVDLSKASAAQKESLRVAVANAAKSWQTPLNDAVVFTATQSASADIQFNFDPSSGGTGQWVQKTSPYQLVATMNLKSGGDATKFAQVTFGKYLGLATPKPGAQEVLAVQKILNLNQALRSAIVNMAPEFVVPAGASAEFHHLVLDIEKAIETKDFAAAEKLSQQLPNANVTWKFNPGKLDENQKGEYSDIADAAEKNWNGQMGGKVAFKRVTTSKADIVIGFEPVLAKISGTNEIAGATWFLGADATHPSVEAVIGLKRGPNLAKVVGREVFNECLFTFGRYLGLAPSPLLGSVMGRIEGQMINANILTTQEIEAAKKILELSTQLRDVIHKRQIISSGQPGLALDRTDLVFKEQIQGDEGRTQILVTNTGTSLLELDVRGDCGCITGNVQSTLAPGKSTLLTGIYNTTELAGDIHHNLILRTNDPDRPILIIPCSISVIPRAEVVFSGTNTVYLDSGEKQFTFYVNSADEKIFNIIEASVVGMPFTVTTEPFKGEVSNFMRLGAKQAVRGYKVTVDTSKLAAKDVFGRSAATVYLRTDSKRINFIKAQIFVQNGIVSLPDSVYFGSPQGASDSTFVLIRLGRPFKILKITSDSKYLTFEIKPNIPVNPSAYTIRAIYDGKALGHRFKGTITVETDDPKQPIMKLPFQTNQT